MLAAACLAACGFRWKSGDEMPSERSSLRELRPFALTGSDESRRFEMASSSVFAASTDSGLCTIRKGGRVE